MPSETTLLAGRYRLEYVLGSGGMGRVWRARDETLHRPVAVKEVHRADDLTAREREALSERTMREARMTAQLNHPGVVATYDAVVEDGSPFIVMELVPSTNLADRVAEDGPLARQEVARIGSRLVEALRAAHRQGIAHRDVKPSNVLLANDGRVLLGDFGIATRESDPSLTATGLLLGSPAYMAPERLRSERTGFAADMWSLGATLYAALEGGPPFRAETTMGTITAIMTDELVPPQAEGPLADAILGMLVKDPEQRLTLDEVGALLDRELRQPAGPGDTASFAVPSFDEPEHYEEPVREPVREAEWEEPAWTASPAKPPPFATEPERSRRPRLSGLLVALAAVMLVVLVVAAVVRFAGPDDSGGEAGAPSPSAEQGEQPRADSGGDGRSTRGDGSRDESEPTTQAADVPAGFRSHRDGLGFRIAVPSGWNRRLDGPTRVDFVAPSGDRFVRIDQRPQALPSAAGAWRQAEPGVADALPGYQRIRIDPVPHPRWNVADWEFTWQGDSGRVHVLNRGIATDTRGFAVYVSAPDATWDRQGQRLFDVVSRSFEPTPRGG
jgi:eukaryotic-like serine/threonine-protein kinase